MQLIRKVVITFLVIAVFASSNYIFNDNADYQKASAAEILWEIVPTTDIRNYNFDFTNYEYRYYLNASYGSVQFFDKEWKELYKSSWSDVKFSILDVPIGTAIIGSGYNGKSYEALARKPKNPPINYNPSVVWEVYPVSDMRMIGNAGLDHSKYEYKFYFAASYGSVQFFDNDWKELYKKSWTNYQLQSFDIIPEYKIMGTGNSGKDYEAIGRRLKNTSPNLNLLTPNNQVLS